MEKEIIKKILSSDNVVESINKNLVILLTLIPELKDMIDFPHNNPQHHLNVWDHTLLALSISPNDFYIRFVLLLHDIGKPHSYQDEEIRHFYGHGKESAYISERILKRLNFSDSEVNELTYLIKEHDSLITKREMKENTELARKKFYIQMSDGLAHNPSKLEKRVSYLLSINEKLNYEDERKKNKIFILDFYNKNAIE